MPNHYPNLNPDKALIWRITHRQNLPWILANGLHAGTGSLRSPNWVTIGNQELIDRRAHREVPLPPGGVLNDYVPFYFTPFSPMLYNIYTGRGGVMAVAKVERYQAEALIHEHVPTQALLGAVCYTAGVQSELQEHAAGLGVELDVRHMPQWYF